MYSLPIAKQEACSSSGGFLPSQVTWTLLNVQCILVGISAIYMLEVLWCVCNIATPAVDATTSDVEFCMKCKLHHSNPGNELVFCDSCMTCEFWAVPVAIAGTYVKDF